MKGWTESLSAGQVLVFAMMIGVVNVMKVTSEPVDIVPVDIVSNMIISATSYLG